MVTVTGNSIANWNAKIEEKSDSGKHSVQKCPFGEDLEAGNESLGSCLNLNFPEDDSDSMSQ